ncbi:porin family protein [Tannerella sp.]|uniref:porin family protein n=1 Tax=Tannerella sp. TaxID=2382127 RepID=UPI0026DC1F81|nr:porin family protein [Tannerella sp.]MDO4702931.1 porin family protein [Tannerella sp.]
MKRVLLLLLGTICFGEMVAHPLVKQEDKRFNLGLKVGLKAMQTDISSIDLDGVMLEEIHLKHSVGYTAGFFVRVNVDRFFVQPSASWNYSKGDISFDVIRPASAQTNEGAMEFPQSMTMQVQSLEVPVVIGYHLIKQNPYILSVIGGGKLKYNYDVRFTPNGSHTSFSYKGDTSPYHWAVYTAVEVVIGKLVFDIGYEYGLRQLHSDFEPFSYDRNSPASSMRMSKYLSGLSMSVGILF